MLRGKTIVDGDHDDAGLEGELATEDIVRVQVSKNPSPAMKVDQRRQHTVGGSIQSHRNRPRRSLCIEITNDRQHGRWWSKRGPCLPVQPPGLRCGNLIDRRLCQPGEVPNDGDSLRIERRHIQRLNQTTDAAAVWPKPLTPKRSIAR